MRKNINKSPLQKLPQQPYLRLLVGSWKKRKMEGEKGDKVKELKEGEMGKRVHYRGPIRTGPAFLQGEKGKQIASTVIFIKSHFEPSHPLCQFQDTLFTCGLQLLLPVTSLCTDPKDLWLHFHVTVNSPLPLHLLKDPLEATTQLATLSIPPCL